MKIQEQISLAKEAFEEFKSENCDVNGILKKTNLSERQLVGKKRLRRRVLNKEIIVANTDKSGKYVITTPDIYIYAASKHIEKDLEVSWQEMKPTEVLLNRHYLHMAASFRMGVKHEQVDRVNSALWSSDNQPPAVDLMLPKVY